MRTTCIIWAESMDYSVRVLWTGGPYLPPTTEIGCPIFATVSSSLRWAIARSATRLPLSTPNLDKIHRCRSESQNPTQKYFSKSWRLFRPQNKDCFLTTFTTQNTTTSPQKYHKQTAKRPVKPSSSPQNIFFGFQQPFARFLA